MSAPSKESVYRSMKRLFKNYIRGCARKNIFWNLSIEQFHKITQGNCTYCGKVPVQISRNYKYNGIDRINPSKGYEPDNSISCCGPCNFIKGNRLDYEEMKVVAEALVRFRAQRATRI